MLIFKLRVSRPDCSTLIGPGLSRLCSDWLESDGSIKKQLKPLVEAFLAF